jgi:hypothetical protein
MTNIDLAALAAKADELTAAKAIAIASPKVDATAAFSLDDVLSALGDAFAAHKGVYETATTYAAIAVMRGASVKVLETTISDALAKADAADTYSRRIKSDASRIVGLLVSDADRKAWALLTLPEVFNALNTNVNLFLNGKGWRNLNDRLSLIDPKTAKKAADKAEKEAKAKAEAETLAAAEAAKSVLPAVTITLEEGDATTPHMVVIRLLQTMTKEERADISAAIYEMDKAHDAERNVAIAEDVRERNAA